MYAIVRRFTPYVEEYSVDECFADITELPKKLKCSYEEITRKIKETLESDLGMSFSIGVAPTKTLAKIASRFNKPAGFTAIPHKNIPNFLKDIPIGAVWGIGPSTSVYLQKKGITTALELAQKPEWWIHENASKPYLEIWHELRGQKINNVREGSVHQYKSIMKTQTFRPTTNERYILAELSKNIEVACDRLREHDLEAREMSIYLKTQTFRYTHRVIRFNGHTADPQIPLRVMNEHFKTMCVKGVEYRATGVTFRDILPRSVHQHDLFHQPGSEDEQPQISSVIDDVRGKHGRKALFIAASHLARHRLPPIQKPAQKPASSQNVPFFAIPFWGETRS
jgi:nucleotidyltransferase/DNA polymerase involved in DNA repair